MPPLKYHPGQVAVQDEANTRALADHLSHWVGPVGEFASQADLIVLATRDSEGALCATVLSGPAPLVDVKPLSRLELKFPAGSALPPAGIAGCLVINLSLFRRARCNGMITVDGGSVELGATETFTLCRKYMAPSIPIGDRVHAGPVGRTTIGFDDPVILPLLARAETSFLLSAAPNGNPDVAHRGGPPGFITFDPVGGDLRWAEFLGDGVFKSAGNVRSTGQLTLFVPDLETGDGIEFICTGASYTNIRTSRKQRLDPLVQHKDPFPVQGEIAAKVERVVRVYGAMHARRRIERALKVTSRSEVDVQAPQ